MIHSKKTLATRLGKSPDYIGTDISRGRLPKCFDKYDEIYDEDNEIVRRYMDFRKKKKTPPILTKEELEKFEKDKPKTTTGENSKNGMISNQNLINEKRRVDIQKAVISIDNMDKKNRQLDMQHAKLVGLLSPTTFSEEIITHHIQFMGMLFKQSAENFVNDVIADSGLGAEKRSEYLNRVYDEINKNMENSQEASLKELKKKIKNFVITNNPNR